MIKPRIVATSLLVLLLIGCGATARQKTIHAITVATDVSREKFVQVDLTVQDAILATSNTEQQFQARITSYRAKRQATVEAFLAVYQAISTAYVLAKDPDLTKLNATIKALHDLLEQIDKLKSEF